MKFNDITTIDDYLQFIREDKTILELADHCINKMHINVASKLLDFNNTDLTWWDNSKSDSVGRPDLLEGLIAMAVYNSAGIEYKKNPIARSLNSYQQCVIGVLDVFLKLSVITSLSEKINKSGKFESKVVLYSKVAEGDVLCCLQIKEHSSEETYMISYKILLLKMPTSRSQRYLWSIIELDEDEKLKFISEVNFSELDISFACCHSIRDTHEYCYYQIYQKVCTRVLTSLYLTVVNDTKRLTEKNW